MESIRPLKEEMIKERMEGIKIAIIEKCANKKIEVLTLKLQDAYRGMRGLFGGVNGVQEESWLDTLELAVDNCVAEAAGYCEKIQI